MTAAKGGPKTMKKLRTLTAFLMVMALIMPLFAVRTNADGAGRPESYGTDEFPQKYGRLVGDINVNTIGEDLKITMTPDKKVLSGGRISFTLTVQGGENGVAINALGIIPVYSTKLFDPVTTAGSAPQDVSLKGKFLFDSSPMVESSLWTENMNAFTVVAAWQMSDPAILPSKTDTDIYTFSLVPKEDAAGPTEVSAYVTLKRGELEFSKLVSVTVGTDERAIRSASVTVGSDLSLKVRAKLPESAATPVMRFEMENSEAAMVSGVKDGDAWLFVLGGIGWHRITDVISFRLFSGIDVIDSRAGFTVKTYAETLLERGGSENAEKAAACLLAYGALAQKTLGYKTDELATAGFEDVIEQAGFADTGELQRKGVLKVLSELFPANR